MTPADNVLYFRGGIDVRLCLKNGYSTMKRTWWKIAPKEYVELARIATTGNTLSSALGRYNVCMKYQNLWDIPFRKDSFRVAIKRDPVQRFISAVSYLDSIKVETQSNVNRKHYIDLTHVTYNDIDNVISALENQTLRDEHFFSQTYFMGDINQYDKIYDISDLSSLLILLEEYAKHPKGTVSNFWENRTKRTDKRIKLSSEQELRIVKLYAKDYANGWC